MKVAIACDHGAFGFKASLKAYLIRKGHQIEDFGTNDSSSCDYPDFGLPAVKSVANGRNERAILTCTNGIGMSMVANKINGIKAALVYSETAAEATRRHHDSNVICLGAKEFSEEKLLKFLDIWLNTDFDGGRHARRVGKFPDV